MTIEKVIKFFGSKSAACASIGLTRSAFTNWEKIGYIPYPRQLEIEIVTKGKLKADLKQINHYLMKKIKDY